MKITDVRIKLVKREEGILKAVASVTLDGCFVVHDIKVLQGDIGPYIAMPSKKVPDVTLGKDVHKDIAHPLDTPTRDMFKKAVIDAYQAELNKAQD